MSSTEVIESLEQRPKYLQIDFDDNDKDEDGIDEHGPRQDESIASPHDARVLLEVFQADIEEPPEAAENEQQDDGVYREG